jgi:hypothetical protein
MGIVNYVERMKTTKHNTHEGFKAMEDIQAFGETLPITQVVEIPADRMITIKVPPQIPAGATAQVELKIIPFVRKNEKPSEAKSSKLRFTKKELDEILQNAQTPISDSLTGILAHLGDITVEQIREERLAKYNEGTN